MGLDLKDLRGRPGIYTIFVRDKAYVGSAMDMYRRIRKEIRQLPRGEHCNVLLQRAYDKYGVDAVRLGDIKFCDVDTEPELRKFELVVMDRLEEAGVQLFNINRDPTSNPTVGEGSEETKRKMSEAMKRRWQDPEFQKKQSEARKNRPPVSEETKRKQSEASKGNQNALGCKHSDEMNRKRSERMKRNHQDRRERSQLRRSLS